MTEKYDISRRTFIQASASAISGICVAGIIGCQKTDVDVDIPIGV